MAKTFYKLTPKAKKVARKLDKIFNQLSKIEEEVDEVLNFDITILNDKLRKEDIFYLFQEFGDMEFCDMDNFKGRNIDFYGLEQQGLIKETYNDPD